MLLYYKVLMNIFLIALDLLKFSVVLIHLQQALFIFIFHFFPPSHAISVKKKKKKKGFFLKKTVPPLFDLCGPPMLSTISNSQKEQK